MATIAKNTSAVLVRIDEETKRKFGLICQAKGATMSDAVRDFIISIVARNGDIIEEVRNASE